MKQVLFFLSLSFSFTGIAQTKMRPLTDLINKKEPFWPMVQAMIDTSKNKVEILAVDTNKAKDALYQTQVTTRSPLGAVIYNTGGILVDNGWIRILGSGSIKLNRSMPGWNKGKGFKEFGEPSSFYLVADDAIGGFFIMNTGAFEGDMGKIWYLAPDNLTYEPLNMGYGDFLCFCFHTDLDEFYKGLRWKDWKKDVSSLKGDQVFNCFPPLWSTEASDINKVSRKAVPIEEQYLLNLSTRKQLGIQN